MEKKSYRFVPLTENIEIPVPKDCSQEEEQDIIARFKADHDLVELEKEYRHWALQFGEGNSTLKDETFSLEELIQELQETQKQFDQRSA